MVDWDDDHYGPISAAALRLALTSTEPITLRSRPQGPTAALTTRGQATGVLLGGNIRAVGQSVGWGPSYDGATNLDHRPANLVSVMAVIEICDGQRVGRALLEIVYWRIDPVLAGVMSPRPG
jgi:hypothetical protein